MDEEDRKMALIFGSLFAMSAIIQRGILQPDGSSARPSPKWAAATALEYGHAFVEELEKETP